MPVATLAAEAAPSASLAVPVAFVEFARMFSLTLSMRRRSAKDFLSASEPKLVQEKAFLQARMKCI